MSDTSEHESGPLTCPYCGGDRTGPTGHPDFKQRCFVGSCCADWTEDDPLVKRIRTLEADLKAARERERELLVLSGEKARDRLKTASEGDVVYEIDWYRAVLAKEVADNARLAGEVERLKGVNDDPLVCECGSTYPSRVVSHYRDENESLRARLAAAEARVKASGAYVQEVADHAPHEQRLQLLALVDRIKRIDADQTQEEG